MSAMILACRLCRLAPPRPLHRALAAPTAAPTYYEELGVHPQARPREIKAAFYALSKEYHPDKNVADEEALRRFQAISEAWEVLGNPAKKTQYDAARRPRPRDTESSYRYSGYAEYRGGPRRSPNAYGMPRERTKKEHDEWIHQQNMRRQSRTASADRSGSGLWCYFWGSIAAWITCSIAHWFERTWRRASKKNKRVAKDE